MMHRPICRRDFLKVGGMTATGLILGCGAERESALDEYILQKMNEVRIPGLSACLVRNDGVVWANSYGWADIDKKIEMTVDHVENIGSISKTFTTTAIMQLWEKGKFALDDDIDDYLPFSVRNPQHPEDKITIQHLLTHTSSIADGAAYGKVYACGDPQRTLQAWHGAYFTPGNPEYDAADNFHPWRPGTSKPLQDSYCNIAFGLIGILVERISGQEFEDYCQANIFRPLGMLNTSWYVKNIDIETHAIPYTWVDKGMPRGPSWGGRPLGVIREGGPSWGKLDAPDGYVANCFYNHPNFPDGFLRCSVSQLSRYIRCYLNKGELDGKRLLKANTVDTMLTRQNLNCGLCWQEHSLRNGDNVWGHLGNDPGINNLLYFKPEEGIGTAILANTNMGKLGGARIDIASRLFEEAKSLG